MPKTLGWIVADEPQALAAHPLLGRTCRQHVESALMEAGIPLAAAEADLRDFDVLLLVTAAAPCLPAASFTTMVENVHSSDTSVGLLAAHQTHEPLALALPRESWQAALRDKGLSVTETAAALLHSPDTQLGRLTAHSAAAEFCFAVRDAASYAQAFSILGHAIVQKHLQKGIFILDPARTLIEAPVEIGAGTTIYPNNTLQGHTRIGEGCTLYPGNRLQSATLGQATTVESSVLLECAVGSHCTVGPFAYLRPATAVGDHCRIGDFVEVKNSSIGHGTKVSHLTYVGDSDLGQNINLGCGVVFVNYDGKTKARSQVDDRAFIGCNSNLVSPVHIGQDAYIAAGSTITEDVPADSLYVARAHGVIKRDWVKRRKEQGKL